MWRLTLSSFYPWNRRYVLPGASKYPYTVRARTIFTPGASMGTSIILCWVCVEALRSVLPINIQILQWGCMAPENTGQYRKVKCYQIYLYTVKTRVWEYVICFLFFPLYLMRRLIWHLSQFFTRLFIYFSLIVKSRSKPFLEPTSFKQRV